mmetsp:Transcript_116003/g.323079  ORF Transcript_116003/g.323079 Transcript_116003/m.323079 type:complete len:203 (+) Transcript_116003:98-706(+)|eukprot:CAMPEP_0179090956 /NCGR_PEP_ID=MMETSP0796-20121207/41523_1 /TAXON_ID=73915 /ORGANISM="Pyrodinium bahamense, Strain pbaha01" /LENGTH=202 /DNA_ID=CAMNT_0020788535 /DNA_START=78 /DNA_END=686 /DNA_ORIENTATION=-
MSAIWNSLGQTMEVSGEGLVLTKTSGGDYYRHAAAGEVLSSGVHTWEVEITSGAMTNGNRDMMIGVAKQGCDVEKGDHHNKGNAWYLRTHDGNLYGGDMDEDDALKKGKFFLAGDRIGLRLNCDDGSLRFYKNGEEFGKEFPPGTITVPVVLAVELKMQGQSVTLKPNVELGARSGGEGSAAGPSVETPAEPRTGSASSEGA